MIRIKEVQDCETASFAEVPYILLNNEHFWAPPLKKDLLHLLDLKHPFWKHAERKLFIAEKDGSPAGCAAAIINLNHNSFHGEKCGFFGFFDSINDPEVSTALLDSCRDWIKDRGMEIMRGPANPSTNETCGILTEGFDSLPVIMMPYNPPYYAGLMENYGLVKSKDLYAFIRYSAEPFPERFEKILSRANRTDKVRIRMVDTRSLEKELGTLKEIYNDAWGKNWGFIPMTEAEIDDMARGLQPILRPEHLFFADVNGKPAAFTLIIPDLNPALKKANGRLTPFNLLPFLYRIRKAEGGRLLALGVKKEFRNKGLELFLVKQAILSARKLGWKWGELSWILEDNEKIIRTIELMGGKLYKKYRIYEKKI